MPNLPDPVLKLSHITKRFGALVANNDISLQLHAGEVLALLGENGAGKSTLVSILFGHYVADEGQIEVFGKPLRPGDPKAALAAGIGMVHQHFTLADNLSVLDNVMMGSEPLWQPFTRRREARAKLIDVAQRFGLAVDPQAKIGNLSVGERQRVEILKALYRGARILILDEPTAVLTPQESEALFHVLAQMVAQGLSIIFISHKLGEVLRVSHRVAVLRAGKLVAESDAQGTTQAQLAQWMVGHAIAAPRRRPARLVGGPVCTLHQVGTAAGRERLTDLSLELRGGEIVAIAGVSGNGRWRWPNCCAARATPPADGLNCWVTQWPRTLPGWSNRVLRVSPKIAMRSGWWVICRCGRTRSRSVCAARPFHIFRGCAARLRAPMPNA